MIGSIPVLILATLVGLALGSLIAWIVASSRAQKAGESALAAIKSEMTSEIAKRDASIKAFQAEEYRQREELAQLRVQAATLHELKQELKQALADRENLVRELVEARAVLDAERKQMPEKVALIQGAREELSDRFRALASSILDEKAKSFTEKSQSDLGQLLNPLKTQLEQFRSRVDEVYGQESRDRSALTLQVDRLTDLNRRLSEDANNLTKALKGSSKMQGNWGELILDRILAASGLRKGIEYTVQESYSRDDGTRGQPDVVLNLPDNKHLVVDSKVSLTAYAEYVNADSDAARESCLARHVDSVRAHIRGLSERNYQSLYGLNSLDNVILFVPIESAFILATSSDVKLWEEAWRKNVLLVCPSTFLFVVSTVNHLWRQEQQNQNVQEIAQRGADLYDKFVGFVEDMQGIDQRLGQARDSYDKAFNKLKSGRNNLVRQAEKLRELGVRPVKSLSPVLLAADLDELSPPADENAQLSLAAVEELSNRE
jgi:DNA recombination protein RmuC